MTIQTNSTNVLHHQHTINDKELKSCTTITNSENCPMNSDPPWHNNMVHQQQHELSSLTLSSSPTGVVMSPSSLSSYTLKHHSPYDALNSDKQPQSSPLLALPSSKSTSDITPEVSKEINDWPIFPMSSKAKRTKNPIRAILDPILNGTNTNMSGKVQISLALGDPIVAGAGSSNSNSTVPDMDTTTTPLMPCPNAICAVQDLLQKENTTAAASYTTAIGTIEGRNAIAKYHSHPYYTYNPNDDIIIANGCSGALELLLSSLLETNNNNNDESSSILLVPAPGFPLYRVIAESHGATVLSYPLLPDQEWEIDIEQLHQIIQDHQQEQQQSTNEIHEHNSTKCIGTIRGIVINNPSNPTGAVYSTQHLQQIVHLCQQYHIPIIADEIYGDMIFTSDSTTIQFTSIAEIAAQMGQIVPVITASGIGKQFLLPGWRIGWICFQDNIYGSIQQVKEGAKRLAQVVLGASHLAQVSIPSLLLVKPNELHEDANHCSTSSDNNDDNITKNTAMMSYDELMTWKCTIRNTLYKQAKVLCGALQQIGPCLHVIEPRGAMYAMVQINVQYFNPNTIQNDIDFMTLLYQEENVIVLPGTCFHFPNSFRVVFCAPIPTLQEAAKRIAQFCHRHLLL